MSSTEPASKPRRLWPFIAVGTLLVVGVLSRSCGDSKTPTQLYAEMNKEANDLAKNAISADEDGDPIAEFDRINAIKAGELYAKMADYLPVAYAPLYSSGVCFRIAGDYEKALVLLDAALKRFPPKPSKDDALALPDIHFNLSRCWMAKKEYPSAVHEADLAVLFNAKNPDYFWARATAYAEMKKFDQAKANLDAALKLDPNHKLSVGLKKFLTKMKG